MGLDIRFCIVNPASTLDLFTPESVITDFERSLNHRDFHKLMREILKFPPSLAWAWIRVKPEHIDELMQKVLQVENVDVREDWYQIVLLLIENQNEGWIYYQFDW